MSLSKRFLLPSLLLFWGTAFFPISLLADGEVIVLSKSTPAYVRPDKTQTSPDKLGVRTNFALNYGTNDAYGLGFGASISTHLTQRIRAGSRLDYFFGTSTDGASYRLWMLSGEGAYPLQWNNRKTIIPFGGVGVASLFAAASANNTTGGTVSSTKLAVYPGCTLHINDGERQYGGDVRIIFIENQNALVLSALYPRLLIGGFS